MYLNPPPATPVAYPFESYPQGADTEGQVEAGQRRLRSGGSVVSERGHNQVMHGLDDVEVSDGDPVAPALIPQALTAAELVFADGATQAFQADGGTTYVENGRPTRGKWYVDSDGQFGSFWPPNYRANYDLRWMVENGAIVGLRFTELNRRSRFDGRYRA
jgi:hypothetical protein